jgi:hypothetical protein
LVAYAPTSLNSTTVEMGRSQWRRYSNSPATQPATLLRNEGDVVSARVEMELEDELLEKLRRR